MTQNACPVCDTITAIKDPLDAGRIKEPRARRILDDILNLIQDIAWGMAGDDHLIAIESLLEEMGKNCSDPVGVEVRTKIRSELDTHDEVFRSHIKTQNCTTGACICLLYTSPSPRDHG